jgi:GT2 family glycosyltransferase
MLDLSIIVPFKDKADMTLECVHSLYKYSDPFKELILISNNSSHDELAKIREGVKKYSNVSVIVHDHPFNFQTLNNEGARQSTGQVIFMLNNDTVLHKGSRGLIKEMYTKAIEKDAGAVGAVLLFEDQKTIQHAGVYLVPGGTADHLYINKRLKHVAGNPSSPFDITENLRVNAVTAAALMVSRKHFDAINGMDENFIVCGGDVDLCLRLDANGYKNYLIGSRFGTIIHKESKTRSLSNVPYVDFCESYRSYSTHFDVTQGDSYLPWKEVQHAKEI